MRRTPLSRRVATLYCILVGFNAAAAAAAAAAAVVSSQYPLLHIGEKMNCSNAAPSGGCTKARTTSGGGIKYRDYNYPWTEADADVMGAGFSLIHVSTKDPAEVELWHARAPRAPAVKYIETVPVCGGSSGQATPFVVGCNATHNFETGGFRRDARMYHVGNLTEPLAAGASSFRFCGVVVYCCGRYGAPLRASTAPGSFGDYGNGTRYVTFVRLGDELLKVMGVASARNPDPASRAPCQQLSVERGLDGSVPAPAAAGAPLLAPIYKSTPVWDGAKASGKLVYQADYRSFYAWSSLANFTVDAVRQLGYDGAWFDSWAPDDVANGADPAGNKVAVWDVANGRRYTLAGAFAAQQGRLQSVWAALERAQLPHLPVLWANNFEKWFPSANAGTSRGPSPGCQVFMVNSSGNRPFDGCSLESWTASFDGPCFAQTDRPGKININDISDEAHWVARTNILVDAARRNLSVAAMTGSAGCQSPLQTYLPAPNRTQLDLLHYASFLLAVRRAGGGGGSGGGDGGGDAASAKQPMLGTSAFFAADAAAGTGLGAAKLWAPYTWELGAPLVPAPAGGNVTAWRVPGPISVYVRYFANGAVVVNPGAADATAQTALVRGPYKNELTGETDLTSVKMPRQSALVLLRVREV